MNKLTFLRHQIATILNFILLVLYLAHITLQGQANNKQTP